MCTIFTLVNECQLKSESGCIMNVKAQLLTKHWNCEAVVLVRLWSFLTVKKNIDEEEPRSGVLWSSLESVFVHLRHPVSEISLGPADVWYWLKLLHIAPLRSRTSLLLYSLVQKDCFLNIRMYKCRTISELNLPKTSFCSSKFEQSFFNALSQGHQ